MQKYPELTSKRTLLLLSNVTPNDSNSKLQMKIWRCQKNFNSQFALLVEFTGLLTMKFYVIMNKSFFNPFLSRQADPL